MTDENMKGFRTPKRHHGSAYEDNRRNRREHTDDLLELTVNNNILEGLALLETSFEANTDLDRKKKKTRP